MGKRSREFDEMFREAEIDNLVNEEAVAYSQSRLKYEETLAAVDYASNSSFERGIAIGEERGREAERMDTASPGSEPPRAEAIYILSKIEIVIPY
ncbi:hypothetical protein, partial [Bacteroides caecimuris]|jgi:hypothetical protein|uniref:hypothetical protein n=1 Tax=Bacteroides caecimuris TaxID=1796613 RepID=UPI0026E53C82